MKKLFFMASFFGVQITAEDVIALGFELSEEDFKYHFKIERFVQKGFLKNKHYKYDELVKLAKEVELEPIDFVCIYANEIEYLHIMKANAIGYKKTARALELQDKIDVIAKERANLPVGATPKPEVKKVVSKPTATATTKAVKTQGSKPTDFDFDKITVEQIENSGLHKKSRRYILLLSEKLTVEQIIKRNPQFVNDEIYIQTEDYLALVQIAKKYFAPQVEQAKKSLQNKLKM